MQSSVLAWAIRPIDTPARILAEVLWSFSSCSYTLYACMLPASTCTAAECPCTGCSGCDCMRPCYQYHSGVLCKWPCMPGPHYPGYTTWYAQTKQFERPGCLWVDHTDSEGRTRKMQNGLTAGNRTAKWSVRSRTTLRYNYECETVHAKCVPAMPG